MKSWFIFLFIIAFILILMAITNPSKVEYVDWTKTKLLTKTVKISEISKYIDLSLERKDFVFFSVYMINNKVSAIGVFNNFISYVES